MNAAPIGIFDSGLGGLSVWKEVSQLLPHESIIYYADSANCPYGPKPQEEIIQLSSRITEFLLAEGCKLIVVACNTATAAAIKYLRTHYEVTFVGMEPAIKPAAQQTRTGHIGILATAGTFEGMHFRETRHQHAGHVEVHIQVGEGLVTVVENGELASEKTRSLLHRYLDPMLAQGIDQLVLGCTHYPFLRPLIEEIVGPGVEIIDPAPAVARQVKRRLETTNMLAAPDAAPSYRFWTSGDQSRLNEMVRFAKQAP